MKIAKESPVSGCIIWIIMSGIFSACLLPSALIIGGFTFVSDFAIQTIGPIVCPDGTTTDDFGNSQPSTTY